MHYRKLLPANNIFPVKKKIKLDEADSNTVWIKEEPQCDEKLKVDHVDHHSMSMKEGPRLDQDDFNKASIREEAKLDHTNFSTVSMKTDPKFDVDSNTVLIKEEPGLKDLEVRFNYMQFLFHSSPLYTKHYIQQGLLNCHRVEYKNWLLRIFT